MSEFDFCNDLGKKAKGSGRGSLRDDCKVLSSVLFLSAVCSLLVSEEA